MVKLFGFLSVSWTEPDVMIAQVGQMASATNSSDITGQKCH